MQTKIIDERWPAPERAGYIASIASVGGTFAQSDLPRSVRDQAVASGLISAVNHGVVTTSQTLLRAMVRVLAPTGHGDSGLAADYAAQLAGIGVGLLTWAGAGRMHHSESTGQLGRRIARSCTVGLVATAAGEVGGRLQGRVPNWLLPSRRPAAAVLGAGIATVAVYRQRPRASTGSPSDGSRVTQLARSAALGTVLSAALTGIGSAEHALARRIAAMIAPALPPGPVGREAAAATGRGLVLWATAATVHGYVHRAAMKSQHAGSVIDEQYRRPPQLPTVSGGPCSAVRYDSIGQEGARFVQRTSSVADITETMGACRAAPVRAFVGWDTPVDEDDHRAVTSEQRVALAMRELEALGGFDRAFLCVAVPAGTGFVNPVAVGALEYLTRGDCATVALQYSLRRSFYSTTRVPVSSDLNRLLLAAITERLQSLAEPRRPAVLLYGESLGAWAAQATFNTIGPQALDHLGVQSALFPGTPARSVWARKWRAHPTSVDPGNQIAEVATYQEWRQLPDERRAQTRVILLSHDDDPVTVFERSLLVRPARARRVMSQPAESSKSPGTRFRPLTTFTLTAIDMKNAMGNGAAFTTRGHDYRGDIVGFVAAAYNLPHDDTDIDRIEAALTRQLISDTPGSAAASRSARC